MKIRKSLACLSIAVFSGSVFCTHFPARAAISGEMNEGLQSGDFHLAAKSLAYRYKDMYMAANIVGYNYIGGMMLPLSFTADITGSFMQVDTQRGRVEGWVETPENTFLLDMPSRRIVIGGQERVLPQGVATVVGSEMYVDASFLATLLPVNYQINYDTNVIDLQPQKDLRVFQRMDFVNRYFENIRKQAGLPYRPWTLEEAIAASSPEQPVIQQPALPRELAPATDGVILAPQMAPAQIVPQTPPSPAMPQPLAETQPLTVEPPVVAAPIVQSSRQADTLSGEPQAEVESPQRIVSESVFGAPGVSQTAPIGAVVSSPDVPQLAAQPAPSVEDNEENDEDRGGSLRLAGQNIALDTADGAQLAAVQNPALNENNLLILEPQINNVKGDYIEVYQHDGGYYLPLGYLMDLLEIGIGVNPAALEASGFFITEDSTFYLNGVTNEAVVKGEKTTFPAGLVVANPFELYVDAQLLAKLLPLDFALNMTELTLDIHPREELPLQARLKRGQQWSKINMWKKYNQLGKENVPVINTPYKAATVPTADVRLGTNYNSTTGSVGTQASVVASGDLGYLNTETFAIVNTTEDDTFSSVRFKAGRTDREGNLLGPLKAKEAYVGDVQSYPMPLVSSSELGRGVRVSNRELLRPDQFDETDFYGDAQPGWEVELYQNNVLIDFQVVGEDGRYSFNNIPINYGDNTFRIVQYGPQGQKTEEVREFNIDDQMPKPGKVQYAVSANEQRQGLIDLSDSSTISTGDEGLAVIGMAEYGVNDKLSVGAGYGHVPVSDFNGNVAEYDFATANLRTSIMGVRTNVDTAYDVSNGGWAMGVAGLARYGQTNIRGEQRFYQDFDSAERLRSFLRPLTLEEILNGVTDRRIESRMETRTDLSINRPFSTSLLGNISTSGNLRYETFEEGQKDFSLSGRVSKNYLGSNFASGLRYRMLDLATQGSEDYIDGTFSVRHYFDNDILLRGALRYQMLPDLELSAINLSVQKQWTEDLNTRLEYTESLSDVINRQVSGYLNWDFDKFYLSPRFQIDEDFEYLVGLELQFSLGMDDRTRNWYMTSERVANTGAVSAQVFMDENADGIMNENETPLEGVTLNNKSYTTDEDGLAFIPRMQVFQPTQVRVDKASVAGMGATPKEKAYAVVSRPGITTKLDYPVVPTLEIEGKAYLDTADRQVEYPGLMLELVNSDGEVVREVRTEFDGYYYLDDVYPGQYTLRVAEKEVESKNLLAKSYDIDTTTLRDKGEYEGFVGGYDFMVARADSPTPVDMPETMVADVEEAPQESGQAEERVATLPEAAIPQPETAQTALPAAEPAATVENIMPPKTADNIRVDTPVAAAKIPATPTSPEEERNVFVQAGMYCDYTNAQRQVDTLTIAGFNASLKGRSFKGQSCYLVHVGPAQDLAAAEMITQELQDMGLEKPIIVEENAQLYE